MTPADNESAAALAKLLFPSPEEVKRLEANYGAECRARIAEVGEHQRLLGRFILGCVVLGGLTLWYMSSYMEARGALKDVCKFVSSEAVKLPDEELRSMGEEPVGTLRGADDTCFEQRALPRSRY
jgi:hypothetical protein